MKPENYRIHIDGAWDLHDLYTFPRAYAQIYSVLYAFDADLSNARLTHRDSIFTKYPWRGGYSALNFYNNLYRLIPRDERPKVISIQFASPGWIDLGAYVVLACSLRHMLIHFSEAGRHINETYGQIQKGIHDRKLNDIKLKTENLRLKKEDIKFVMEASDELAKLLGYDGIKQMHNATGNPLVTLKILTSMYRRIEILDDYEQRGKTKIKEWDPLMPDPFDELDLDE